MLNGFGDNAVSATVVMYSHDGYGLGHLRRNLYIAQALRERRPGATILLVAGLGGIPGLELGDGIDLVKLPSITKTDTDVWEPRTLHLEPGRVARLRRDILHEVLRCTAPDLVVVDHVPAGVWGELVPGLEWLRRQPRRSKVVLGIRDILDEPAVVRRTWTDRGYYDLLARLYDRVLIYGSAAVFDTAGAYGLTERIPGLFEYCGYVCAHTRPETRARTRARLGIGAGEQLVLVTGGGGLDSYPMMERAVAVARSLRDCPTLRWTFVAGPLMPRPRRNALVARAAGLPVTVVASSPEMPALLQAADLVMTMGGYNALIEALRAERPILAMPRQGPSAEQRTRTDLFERLGLLRNVSPTADTVELAAHVVCALQSAGPPRRLLDTGGLRRAANHLAQLLDATVQPGVPSHPIDRNAPRLADRPRAGTARGAA